MELSPSSRITAITLLPRSVCFAREEHDLLFECRSIIDSEISSQNDCILPSVDAQPNALLLRTHSLRPLPAALDGRQRLLAVQLVANRKRQHHIARVFEQNGAIGRVAGEGIVSDSTGEVNQGSKHEGSCVWSHEHQVASKPFATVDTMVSVPELSAASNFIAGKLDSLLLSTLMS